MFKNLRFSAEDVLYNFFQHTRLDTDKDSSNPTKTHLSDLPASRKRKEND